VFWTGLGRAPRETGLPNVYEVHRSDSRGTDMLLDVGLQVDPFSLAVAGGRAYWTAAGQPKTAT